LDHRKLFDVWVFSLLIMFSSMLFVEVYFQQRFIEKSEESFLDIAQSSNTLLNSMMSANHEKVALAALYLSQDKAIKTALLKANPDILDFHKHFEEGAKFGSLENAYIQIIDAQGNSFYRSWTKKKGDHIIEQRKDLQVFFEAPKVMHTLSAGIYSLTMKTIVPIYDDQKFIGAFEVIGKLQGVIEDLKKAGVYGLILLDKSYRPQMLDQADQRYINDALMINEPEKNTLVQAIKVRQIDRALANNADFFICENTNWYVSFKKLVGIDNTPLAGVYLFQPLSPITKKLASNTFIFHTYIVGAYVLFWLIAIGWFYYQKSQKNDEDILSLQSQVQFMDHEMSTQTRFWQKVIDGLDDMVLVVHKDHRNILMNQAAGKVNELRKLRDKQCLNCSRILFNDSAACPAHLQDCPVRRSFASKRAVTAVEEIKLGLDTRFFEFTATPLMDKKGEVSQVVEVGHDITPYVEAKQQLEEQKNRLNQIAYYDSLTGLPNRRLFMDRLQQAINFSRRNGAGIAVMFMDLDLFKQINDTHGHEVGDQVLVHCSERLQASVRNSDTVSRLGGDEFTIIVEQIRNKDSVVDIVQNVLQAIHSPCLVAGQSFYLTASIGISMFPDDGDNLNDLLKNADTAMYQAKENGRNNYAFYDAEMTRKAVERVELENKLRLAIEKKQFEVYYQPQFDIGKQNITGFEALVRWHHPQDGIVLPFEFLALAEETGMIIEIGQQVMLESMKVIRQWHEAGLTDKRMAINISAKQFASQDLMDTVKQCLDETSCRPEWVELEITETSVMKNISYAAQVLQELKEMGVTISIDDFGTGYSSLVQLKRMPIDKIKIDQSFIYHLPYDNEDAEITKTIINMAHNLSLTTIAEGVENQAQSECMKAFGCPTAQGFLFSRPLPKQDIEVLLSEQKSTSI